MLVVEDEALLATFLQRALAGDPRLEVVGVASSVAEVRTMLRDRVDVVLMDYLLPDGTGAEATRAVKARWPAARVVMLSGVADDPTILDAIQAGADGYLAKPTTSPEDVVLAVKAAHAGEILLPRSVIVGIAQRVAAHREGTVERRTVEPLTPRELEVLRALAEGLPGRQICEQLAIAPNTLRTHVQNIIGKLHVHSKLEAVSFAIRHRIVEPPRGDSGD